MNRKRLSTIIASAVTGLLVCLVASAPAELAWAQPVPPSTGVRASGSLTTNRIVKATGANTIGDSQGFDNGTTFMIGATSVAGTVQGQTLLLVSRATGDTVITAQARGEDRDVFMGVDETNNYARMGTSVNQPLVLRTNNTDRAQIDGSGFVGVNATPSSAHRLLITGTAGQNTVTAQNTATGQTAQTIQINGQSTGSYDTTAAPITVYGLVGNVTASRSAGSNPLTGVGLYGNATTSQVPMALLTDNGDVSLNAISGHAKVRELRHNEVTPASFSTQQDNYAGCTTAATTCRLNCTAGNCDITGIAGGASGRVLEICNVGSGNITFHDEHASSTAANRFAFGPSSWLLQTDNCGSFEYDGTSSRNKLHGWGTNIFTGLTVVGGNITQSSGSIETTGNVDLDGNLTVDNNTILGSSNADTVTITGKINAHVHYTGTAPSLSSCGSGPTIVGNDMRGKINTGTGNPSACTVTFATGWATNAPICVANGTTTGLVVTVTTASTSAITLGFSAGVASDQPIYYHCDGYL